MSKLYTEEQVKQLLFDLGDVLFNNCQNGIAEEDVEHYSQDVLKDLTPIELPTVKEIELKSVEYSTDSETKEFYKDCCWDFQNGAKWMRDKIKGGNNE